MNFIKIGSQMINLDQVVYMEEGSFGVYVYTLQSPNEYHFILPTSELKDVEEAIEKATTSNRR